MASIKTQPTGNLYINLYTKPDGTIATSKDTKSGTTTIKLDCYNANGYFSTGVIQNLLNYYIYPFTIGVLVTDNGKAPITLTTNQNYIL